MHSNWSFLQGGSLRTRWSFVKDIVKNKIVKKYLLVYWKADTSLVEIHYEW